MRRIVLSFVLGSALFASGLGASCKGNSAGAGGTDQTNPEVADVIFEGGATDEAAISLLHATLVNDPTSAAAFTSPTNTMVVPATSTPTFTWKIGLASIDAPATDRRFTYTEPRHVSPSRVFAEPPSKPTDLASEALGFLLSGVPSAYAHGTPTSGPAYFLVFSTTANAKLLRVFTTNMTYTPDATAFGKLKSAGDTIHAVITNADFDQNRIAQAGGPWRGTEITFTVK